MMEIDEEDILRTVAGGGSMDYSVWPALLPRIVARIEKIAQDEFPTATHRSPSAQNITIPSSIPPPANTTAATTQPGSETTDDFLPPLPSSPIEPSSSSSSQETNKENAPIPPRSAAPPTSAPSPSDQLSLMLTEITSTLTSTFPTNPPHTVQRLSDLILRPKQHYRSLPTYLHALDRAVHVTSGLNIYPLPPADMSAAAVLPNGAPDLLATPSPWATPGSDEALGGALLTPIPWLQPNHQGIGGSPQPQAQPQAQPPSAAATATATPETPGQANDLEGEVRTESTETIDGPNGMGSIETVSVSVNGIPSMGARGIGVTQGELLRQEQRAGVVPVSQLVPSHHVHNHSPSAQQLHQAHLQAQRASSASPDSSTSATSSATLEEERTTPPTSEPANEEATAADAPVSSIHSNADEDEKPHARGPEEIGADDLGPQSASNTSTIDGPGGVEMQGIDIQAAVGRKANDEAAADGEEGDAAKAEAGAEAKPDKDDGDKMDVEVERATTPKREAEDELEKATKKLKENPEAAAAKPTEGEGAKEDQDTAMDRNEA